MGVVLYFSVTKNKSILYLRFLIISDSTCKHIILRKLESKISTPTFLVCKGKNNSAKINTIFQESENAISFLVEPLLSLL